MNTLILNTANKKLTLSEIIHLSVIGKLNKTHLYKSLVVLSLLLSLGHLKTIEDAKEETSIEKARVEQQIQAKKTFQEISGQIYNLRQITPRIDAISKSRKKNIQKFVELKETITFLQNSLTKDEKLAKLNKKELLTFAKEIYPTLRKSKNIEETKQLLEDSGVKDIPENKKPGIVGKIVNTITLRSIWSDENKKAKTLSIKTEELCLSNIVLEYKTEEIKTNLAKKATLVETIKKEAAMITYYQKLDSSIKDNTTNNWNKFDKQQQQHLTEEYISIEVDFNKIKDYMGKNEVKNNQKVKSAPNNIIAALVIKNTPQRSSISDQVFLGIHQTEADRAQVRAFLS